MTAEWDAKAEWMRRVGASEAQWSTDGILYALTLGPAPGANEPQQEPQHLSAGMRVKSEREERQRLSLAASGRPVLRDAGG